MSWRAVQLRKCQVVYVCVWSGRVHNGTGWESFVLCYPSRFVQLRRLAQVYTIFSLVCVHRKRVCISPTTIASWSMSVSPAQMVVGRIRTANVLRRKAEERWEKKKKRAMETERRHVRTISNMKWKM